MAAKMGSAGGADGAARRDEIVVVDFMACDILVPFVLQVRPAPVLCSPARAALSRLSAGISLRRFRRP
jgi:hypothetical protein